MQPEATRAAFTLSLVHLRRDERRVTALALLPGGTRVFLGLNSGVIEEHVFSAPLADNPGGGGGSGGGSAGAPPLRLVAEKRVFSRAAVADIAPAQSAARLACLSDDGQVSLVSLESFAVSPLHAARGATSLAVQSSAAGSPPPVLLAAAVRAGKGRSRILVFGVLPGATVSSSHQPAVQLAAVPLATSVLGLAWAGSTLLVAVPGGYVTLSPMPVRDSAGAGAGAAAGAHHDGRVMPGGCEYVPAVLADHLHDLTPRVGGIPDLGLGLLLWEQNMLLITDQAGAAVRAPLQLPSPPLALAACGLFVAVLCDDGVHVFDRSSAAEVQHIDYQHDDAHAALVGSLPVASDPAGRAVIFAASGGVLCLQPIALQQQVRELLKRKRFDQALALLAAAEPPAASLLSDGQQDEQLLQQAGQQQATWQQVALAQAGLLLLLECEFEAGLAIMAQLPGSVWQPAQLFPLFPGHTARWLPAVPAPAYWGLHGQQLPELGALISNALELRTVAAAATRRRGDSTGATSNSGTGNDDESDVLELTARSKAAVAAYLGAARGRPEGVQLSDGVDQLLLQLLCDLGDAAAVEALAATPGMAAPRDLADAALRRAGRPHAAALLCMMHGDASGAIDTWWALERGELREAASTSGAVADAGGDASAVAVASVARAMAAGSDSVPLSVLLDGGGLRWLLRRDAAQSLAVLQARVDLEPDTALALLQGEGEAPDLLWQYLLHLLYHHAGGKTQPSLHTQLALLLLDAIAAHIPCALGGRAETFGGSSVSNNCVDAQQLAAMAPRLPVICAPNKATQDHADYSVTGSRASARVVSANGATWLQASLAGGSAGRVGRGGCCWETKAAATTATTHGAHSMAGAGVPSATFFAAALAAPSLVGHHHHQQLLAGGQPVWPLPAAQRPGVSSQVAHAGRRWPPGGGALAGVPVQRRATTHAAHQLGAGALSLHDGLMGAGGIAAHTRRPSRQLSAVAQLLQEQQLQRQLSELQEQRRNSNAVSAGGAAAPHQGVGVAISSVGALRQLPLGLGPWPLPELPTGNTAEAGSAEQLEDIPDAAGAQVAMSPSVHERVLLLRCLLVYHLQASLQYDCQAVLAAAVRLPLLAPEAALLHSRAGDHTAALTALALPPAQLVEGAIAYARCLGSPDSWLTLLELFLRPPAETEHDSSSSGHSNRDSSMSSVRQPDYAAACRVINAEGACLNPQRLLAALPPDMPLSLVGGLLGLVVAGLQHRRRYASVVRSLVRGASLEARAELSVLRAGRVLLSDDTSCHGCGRLIGGRVFSRLPSGVLVCGRCSGGAAAAMAGAQTPSPAPRDAVAFL